MIKNSTKRRIESDMDAEDLEIRFPRVQMKRSRNVVVPSPDIVELQKKINYTPINVYYPTPIPEPDYSDTDESCSLYPSKMFNPCLQSFERQQLHRELLWYTKMGIDILRPKTELKTVLEAVRCKKKKLKESVPPKLTELEMKLQERRKRLEQLEEQKEKRRQQEEFPEFVKVRSRIFPFLDHDLNSNGDSQQRIDSTF